MKSKKTGCLIPVLLAAALLIAGGAWLHSRGLGQLYTVWRMTEQWAQSERADFQATLNTGDLQIAADGWWTESSDGRVYGLVFQDVPVYIREDTLVLDNGRAYSLPALPITGETVRDFALGVLLEGEITVQDNAWHLYLPQQGLTVTAIGSDDRLLRLEVRGTLDLDGAAVPLTLCLTPAEAQSHTVPAGILQTLSAGGATPILEPLEPLMPAVTALTEHASIAGDLTVALDCGVLTVDETLQAEYTVADGTLHLRRGGIHVPVELPALDEFLSPAVLPMLLLRNGEFSERADGWLCTVDVEPELTRELCCALIPELAELDFAFTRMEAEILVHDGVFQSVTLGGSGEIPFLMTTIPISLTMTWDFA